MPSTAIILVNYNHTEDTLLCMDSLMKLQGHFYVYIVDNGGSKILEPSFCAYIEQNPFWQGRVELISSPQNLGFAGGCNLGLRTAQTQNFDWYWLLNNDTQVLPDTLAKLIQSAQQAKRPGIWGSKLLDFKAPHAMQALAGRIHPFWNRPEHIMDESKLHQLDYVVGASYLISQECLKVVGLMPEEYFLYFEETAYCYQVRKKGFELGVALDSVVYHHSGVSSTGATKLYYYHRNLLYFHLKNSPLKLPLALSYIFWVRWLPFALKGDFRKDLLWGVWDFFRGRTGIRT